MPSSMVANDLAPSVRLQNEAVFYGPLEQCVRYHQRVRVRITCCEWLLWLLIGLGWACLWSGSTGIAWLFLHGALLALSLLLSFALARARRRVDALVCASICQAAAQRDGAKGTRHLMHSCRLEHTSPISYEASKL